PPLRGGTGLPYDQRCRPRSPTVDHHLMRRNYDRIRDFRFRNHDTRDVAVKGNQLTFAGYQRDLAAGFRLRHRNGKCNRKNSETLNHCTISCVCFSPLYPYTTTLGLGASVFFFGSAPPPPVSSAHCFSSRTLTGGRFAPFAPARNARSVPAKMSGSSD